MAVRNSSNVRRSLPLVGPTRRVLLFAAAALGLFGAADGRPGGAPDRWGPRPAAAAIDDTLDAVCRITAADGSRGSGCAFERSGGRVYVLTAAHVVGAADVVWCEFWRRGRPGARLPGKVVAVDREADAAVVAVDESAFTQALPWTIAPAAPDAPPAAGTPITSAGCAQGGWPTAFKGIVVDLLPGELCFVPPPANGRSGSPLLDAEGRAILGVIRARTADNATGIATPIARVFQAFSARSGSATPLPPRGSPLGRQWFALRADRCRLLCALPPVEEGGPTAWGIDRIADLCRAEPTQCPGDSCPGPTLVPFGRAAPRETIPLPEVFGSRRPPMPPGPSPISPSPVVPMPPQRPNQPPASPNSDAPLGGESSPSPSGGEPRRGRAPGSPDDRTLLAQELLGLLLGDAETLLDRAAVRAEKLRRQLGDDASTAEWARGYARDFAAEKLADGRFGWTVGKTLAAALGLSGPLSLALAGGLWLVGRRVARRIEQSEPLVVERLWRRISERISERIDERTDQRIGARTGQRWDAAKEEAGGEGSPTSDAPSSAEARHAAG